MCLRVVACRRSCLEINRVAYAITPISGKNAAWVTSFWRNRFYAYMRRVSRKRGVEQEYTASFSTIINTWITVMISGDILLAGVACGRLLGHCVGLCLQAVCGDLKTAWRLSFSDEKRVRGVYTRDTLYKSTSYFFILSRRRSCLDK